MYAPFCIDGVYNSPVKTRTFTHSRAFTLVEISLILLIAALLVVTITPAYFHLADEAKSDDVADILETLSLEIDEFYDTNGFFPDSLADVFDPVPLDPWGNPYQYLRIAGGSAPPGQKRKDRNLVPINSDYDFYSMGPDGDSRPPLTAPLSKDDIVRANNGSYFGVADEY